MTGLYGDPLIVARTAFLKLSNGVAAADRFLKPATRKLKNTRPDTLLIDRTKYASGVPGDVLYLCILLVFYEHIEATL